jgi:hypothetical protein
MEIRPILLASLGRIRNSSTTSQYTWRSFKSVSIDTSEAETCFKHIDNDIHISYVQFGLVVIEIWLVVLSSPQQQWNETLNINSNGEALGHNGTNKWIIRLDYKKDEDNFTIFKRKNPTYHRKVIITLVSHVPVVLVVVRFCHHNTKRCSNAPTTSNDRKY